MIANFKRVYLILFGALSALILLNSIYLIGTSQNEGLRAENSVPAKTEVDEKKISEVETPYHHVGDMRIFTTKAEALPSIRLSDEEAKAVDEKRGIYGGKNDKAHLGGFTDLDLDGVSPHTWRWMMETIGIKSIIDLGCGKGVSSLWFHLQGIDTLCAEGSHDAVQQSLLPPETIVEHDFTRGPWWPETTYDAVWCVEFSEHIQRQYIRNYMTTLRKAALIFVTHSTWGGWHHAEVHDDSWWINKYTSLGGLVHSPQLTEQFRKKAHEEDGALPVEIPNKSKYAPSHLRRTTLVFINPSVAGLEKHEHLFAEPGCFFDYGKPNIPCGQEKLPDGRIRDDIVDAVPEKFLPLTFQEDKEKLWESKVFAPYLKDSAQNNTIDEKKNSR